MSADQPKHRVLCVIRWPVGGIRTWCSYVYSHPAFRDFQLTIAASSVDFARSFAGDLARPNIDFISLPESNRQFFPAVRSLTTASNWSLVHSHGFTAAFATAIGRLGTNIPHLVTQHDVILRDQYRGLKGQLQRQAVSMTLRSADVVHSVSASAAENLAQNFPWLKSQVDKVKVITNGIESERFLQAHPVDLRTDLGLHPDDFLIGFFGRFMSQKGFRYLVEAIHILKTTKVAMRNPVVIAPAGGGFFEREKRQIAALGLDECFRFIPFSPKLGPLIKSVDVVAMPSLWEACGLVAMETLAAGVPLICSDCESLIDISLGSPATIVRKADAGDLASAINAEALHPTKDRAGAYAVTAASRFDVSHAALGIGHLYEMMTSRAHRDTRR